MKILSFDPGKNDFAFSVIKKGKCQRHGFLRTITTMEFKALPDELSRFTTDLGYLITKYKPDFIAMERMQHRPKFGAGAVTEYINVMIGIVLEMGRRERIHLMMLPATTWKTHIGKVFKVPKGEFTMATQKLIFKAPKGMTRVVKGKKVKQKTISREIKGVLAGQLGHDDTGGGKQITPHEADAIGIGCYCWYKITGMEITHKVLR